MLTSPVMSRSSRYAVFCIWLRFSLLLLRAAVSLADSKHNCYPGVGLSLALDHGTSVVTFPDGTINLVAKVEGNNQYKEFMRWMTSEDQSTEPLPQTQSFLQIRMPVVHDAGHWFFEYLKPRPKSSDALVRMLLALRASTEAFLLKPLNTSDVVAPLSFKHDSKRAFLDAALSAAQLSSAIPSSGSYTFAAQAAARANGIGNCLEYIEEEAERQLVLIVDYSHSALTMTLAIEEDTCLVFSRTEHCLALGADQSMGEGYWAIVKALLKDMDMAPPNADPRVPRTVSSLVMTGDSVLKDEMICALEETIGPDLVKHARSRLEAPVFAAAIGAAVASKQRVNGGWCRLPATERTVDIKRLDLAETKG